MNHNDQIEEKAARLWQTDINTDDFWANYTQLLQEAKAQRKRNDLITTAPVLAEIQPPTLVGTTADNAHLPWVKLMVPHWDELPLKIPHHSLQVHNPNAEFGERLSKLFASMFLGVITLTQWYQEAFLPALGSSLLLGGTWLVKLKNPWAQPTTYSFEFLVDEMIYEKKVEGKRKNQPPRITRIHIPYDSIAYIYTEPQGVSIHVKEGSKWLDNRNKSHSSLIIRKRVVAFDQMTAFIRDVINTNYANRLNKP